MRILRVLFVTAIVGFILGLCFVPTYGKYIRLRRYVQYLESEVGRLQDEVVLLSRQLMRAKEDPSFMEEVARRRYKMGMPGETIYVVADMSRKGNRVRE